MVECSVTRSHCRRIIRLRLVYDGPADGAPASVILKTGLPGGPGEGWGIGRQEVEFYDRVASAMSFRLQQRCFDAHWDKETRAWHLLLEDLTGSHAVPARWPLPPRLRTKQAYRSGAGAFPRGVVGRLHVSGSLWEPGLMPAKWSIRIQLMTKDLERFIERAGDLLSHERRALYERLLDQAFRLFARYHSHRDMTIVHGDAHVLNTLPRDEWSRTMFVFLTGTVGASMSETNDLAYMMAVHWYPDHAGSASSNGCSTRITRPARGGGRATAFHDQDALDGGIIACRCSGRSRRLCGRPLNRIHR